jgi:hypothetical protein
MSMANSNTVPLDRTDWGRLTTITLSMLGLLWAAATWRAKVDDHNAMIDDKIGRMERVVDGIARDNQHSSAEMVAFRDSIERYMVAQGQSIDGIKRDFALLSGVLESRPPEHQGRKKQ